MTIRQSRMLGPVRRSLILLIALGWVSGCMLQDFDKLGPGNSSAGGGTGKGGKGSTGGTTASSTDEGGSGGVSGNTGQAGRANGAAGSGATSSTSGGVTGTAGTAGTTTGTSGAPGAGGGGGTTEDPRCPAYIGATGALVSPPSTGFEVDGTWITATGQACHRTESTGNTDGCQDNYYLTCDGAKRKASLDLPSFYVTAPVTGATYIATALARYSPATPPAEASPLVMVASYKCLNGSQLQPQLGIVQYSTGEWVRLGGTVTPTCDASSLTDLYFYVNTVQVKPAGQYDTIDLDDLRVYQR